MDERLHIEQSLTIIRSTGHAYLHIHRLLNSLLHRLLCHNTILVVARGRFEQLDGLARHSEIMNIARA